MESDDASDENPEHPTEDELSDTASSYSIELSCRYDDSDAEREYESGFYRDDELEYTTP